ncbi:zinc-binding dehydrogenase [Nakamurella sp. YIM 132087]|uniref:Zinc-binding dehydrogenase n=1 Tax=Nakamurella alba TaxID=2665158 RepID=A0A7K1FJF3_9ACTN|nr:quinone oxidoreductase [Nakamurella alba]MTD13569.1 zinc-binding dehydrogenase [Nakamurella alba]
MRAVVVPATGGPEILQVSEIGTPTAGPGQLLVRVTVAGINYMDVYQRTGAVPRPTPFTLGVEGVGVVEELGPDVQDFAVGDRVGWFSGGSGSHAEFATVEAGRAVAVPDGITDDQAVAVLMQGITAHYLATDTYPVAPGDPVLVHAAAGGVGQLLTRIAVHRGGTVIGTVSTPAKEAAATAAGASHVFGYQDIADRVKDVTGGAGVAVVYDGVGGPTFDASLASLRQRGVLVAYGTAGGPTPPLEIPRLNSGGSLYVTRPTIAHYAGTTDELRRRAAEVFGWVADATVPVSIGAEFALNDVAQAYRELEGRRTAGKVMLRP